MTVVITHRVQQHTPPSVRALAAVVAAAALIFTALTFGAVPAAALLALGCGLAIAAQPRASITR